MSKPLRRILSNVHGVGSKIKGMNYRKYTRVFQKGVATGADRNLVVNLDRCWPGRAVQVARTVGGEGRGRPGLQVAWLNYQVTKVLHKHKPPGQVTPPA